MKQTLGVLLALPFLLTALGSAKPGLRVTLTAQNHDPRVTLTGPNHQPPPTEQWGYCVRVSTAAGKPVAATIQFRFVSGRTVVRQAGTLTLKKGYGWKGRGWCGSIGGEHNLLEALPRGKKLDFQAVVTANGETVTRNWPIVVQ